MESFDRMDAGGRAALAAPVAYHPALARALKSIPAAILLSQFLYLERLSRKVSPERDGWFYKSRDEVEWETGLTHEQQATARKRLVAAGLVEEYHERLQHRLWYRMRPGALTDLLEHVGANTVPWNPEGTPPTASPAPRPPFPHTVHHGAAKAVNHGVPKPSTTVSSKEQRLHTENTSEKDKHCAAGATRPAESDYSPSRKSPNSRAAASEVAAQFEDQFWRHYPKERRHDKARCLSLYAKLTEGERLECAAGLQRFLDSQQWCDPGLIVWPERFLKRQDWHAYPAPAKGGG